MNTATGYWQTVAATRTVRECRWIDSEALLAPLRDLDVASHAGLVRLFPVLTRQQQVAAVRLFC